MDTDRNHNKIRTGSFSLGNIFCKLCKLMKIDFAVFFWDQIKYTSIKLIPEIKLRVLDTKVWAAYQHYKKSWTILPMVESML